LAEAGAQRLRREARLGYRAEWVSRLAREVADGKLDLNEFEHFEGSTVELKRLLRQIHGVGDYAASNIAMLLGRYDCLAIDTEMMRHLEQRHPRRKWTPKTIAAHYESWHPYEFLAYWYELWSDYREKLGPAEQWSLSDEGTRITSQ
jgi:3-methyladenine DNA glycosylase/8-oxoguanine DNA glycosylase